MSTEMLFMFIFWFEDVDVFVLGCCGWVFDDEDDV